MDKPDILSQVRQKLLDYLRMNSLRSTPERLVLLETVYSTDAPFSAEDLSDQMQKSRMRISRATVYNNLGLFESAGLVRKVFVNDQVLFERTDRSKGTIRMICGSCGKTVEVNDERLRRQIGVSVHRAETSGIPFHIVRRACEALAGGQAVPDKLEP